MCMMDIVAKMELLIVVRTSVGGFLGLVMRSGRGTIMGRP